MALLNKPHAPSRIGVWSRFENGPLLSLATLMLVASTVVMLMEGFNRALFDTSFFWAEELVRFLMIWAFFLALGATGRRGSHIRTDMLTLAVSARVRKMMDLFSVLAGIAFCVLLAWASWPQLYRYYTLGMMSESSLDVPLWAVFCIMPVGALLYLFYYIGALGRVLRNEQAYEDPFSSDPAAEQAVHPVL